LRYNVSDEPRPDCQSFDLQSPRRSSSIGPIRRTAYGPLVLRRLRDGSQEWFMDLDRFPEHAIVFRPGLTDIEGHILDNTAGYQRHSKIMLNIWTCRPQALKDRARRRVASKRQLMLLIHATRTANRKASKQSTWSLPQPPAPRPTPHWTVKIRTPTWSRLPQSRDGR
jgi:hypothetical protein